MTYHPNNSSTCPLVYSSFTMSDKAYLSKLISEGEHQHQDFKYKVMDACKLAKSVSAFANTEGGRLLIGVRDDGHLSGVRSEEEIFMMRCAASEYCRPEAQITFDTYHAEGRTIVVATVMPSDNKPIRALCDDGKWRAYIRVDDENIVASPVHIRIWRDEQSPKGQLVSIGSGEQLLLDAMSDSEALTLPQVVKRSGVSRHKAVVTLARLVRFQLAECHLQSQKFVFSLL